VQAIAVMPPAALHAALPRDAEDGETLTGIVLVYLG
jgi:hypothetical protein